MNNPVFQHKKYLSDEDNKKIVSAFAILRSQELRDELFFSNLHLVEHTVGRYLANWPETRRWKDDMVSVGIQTLLERIDKIDPNRSNFRANTVNHLKSQIEMYLNKQRTSIHASLSTNYRRLREGKPMASVPETSLDKIMEKE